MRLIARRLIAHGAPPSLDLLVATLRDLKRCGWSPTQIEALEDLITADKETECFSRPH